MISVKYKGEKLQWLNKIYKGLFLQGDGDVIWRDLQICVKQREQKDSMKWISMTVVTIMEEVWYLHSRIFPDTIVCC